MRPAASRCAGRFTPEPFDDGDEMKHFYTFLKKKALHLAFDPASSPQNEELAHQINHELMRIGYVLDEPTFRALAAQTSDELARVYDELSRGIAEVVPNGDEYEPIYRSFPQSVLQMSYGEFLVNALVHYWSFGQWRPEDAEHLEREFAVEAVDYKQVGSLSDAGYQRMFDDLLYGNVSLSALDKRVVDFYLDQGGEFEFSRIVFKEIASYVGKRLLDTPSVEILPTRRATTVLRIWAAYSGGDEGLKENTKFSNPSSRQRRVILRTLEACTDLEDSLKSRREVWLRFLFMLHPTTKKNRARFPTLADYADRLRNDPKSMLTYNARVERAIRDRDPVIFELLTKRPGVFMRRLDHMVRLFGVDAIYAWLKIERLRFSQLVTVYNHFAGRADEDQSRAAVLASQSASQMVTYEALEPLEEELVEHITSLVMARIKEFRAEELDAGSVFIDRSLYYTPLATNNRASSLALDAKPIGTAEPFTSDKTLRMYVMWEGKSDIDLSGFVLTRHNEVVKVGWNGAHKYGDQIVYSGDNTGYSEKNAEYLDINTGKIPDDVEWVVVEARIYRGPDTFAGYNGKAHIGWMVRSRPEKNNLWVPKTLEHAMVLASKARTAYLMAYHAPSKNVVYLDMAMGSAAVSTASDAIKMRGFLNKLVNVDTQHEAISWKRLNQGHILELLSADVTADEESAEITFDANTTSEHVGRLITVAVKNQPERETKVE